MPCTTVTNFCNEGKVMLLLSTVRYQVLLWFLVIRALLNMVFTFLETLVY